MGEAIPLPEQISRPAATGYFGFSASRNGVLAYVTGLQLASELVWFDREGKRIGTVGKPGTFFDLSLSPDERRVAVTQTSPQGTGDIWIHELIRDSASQFTFGPEFNDSPVWSSDGSRIVFRSIHEGSQFIYQKGSGGAGKEERLLQMQSSGGVLDCSQDGRFIIYGAFDPKTKSDLWLLPMTGDHKATPLLQTEFNETQGQFSPDGRWLAYTSDESGAAVQVYVQPFPASGDKWPISNSGGWQPRWRGDGKELFYVAPDGQLMVVAILAASNNTHFKASVPQLNRGQSYWFFYDVTADGRRFLINTLPAGGTQSAINVVVNWQAGLKR